MLRRIKYLSIYVKVLTNIYIVVLSLFFMEIYKKVLEGLYESQLEHNFKIHVMSCEARKIRVPKPLGRPKKIIVKEETY